MYDYIDRDLALEKAAEIPGFFSKMISAYDVMEIPVEDVEPVRHGKWKYYHKQGIAVCTNCSFERKLDENFGKAIACPNCGAKMDLEVENDNH